MEIFVIIAAVVVVGAIWYISSRSTPTVTLTKTDSQAPYKVEAPVVQESAPAAAPVKEVTTKTASKPSRAKKPAAEATKAAAKKPIKPKK